MYLKNSQFQRLIEINEMLKGLKTYTNFEEFRIDTRVNKEQKLNKTKQSESKITN